MLPRVQAQVAGQSGRAPKAPKMRSRVNTHMRMLSTILDEQQAGPCGQEVVMFTLQKNKLKEASMCVWLIFSPLDWHPQLDLLTISSV